MHLEHLVFISTRRKNKISLSDSFYAIKAYTIAVKWIHEVELKAHERTIYNNLLFVCISFCYLLFVHCTNSIRKLRINSWRTEARKLQCIFSKKKKKKKQKFSKNLHSKYYLCSETSKNSRNMKMSKIHWKKVRQNLNAENRGGTPSKSLA